ncbi:MAG: type II toxin-antitoxin system HicB family antitoxin [Patescibacteria group bacterium]|nr:type II toxin-antitoxin system HicB family antitoxin [Patescibacteria group bacterium]
MKNKRLTFKVEYEDGWYSASCLESFIVTQGKSFKTLENNIKEAVECHFANELKARKIKPIISLNYTLPAYA